MRKKVGHIKELWRYPVKSMMGQRVATAQIEKYGLLGDRGWAVRDEQAQQLTVVRKTPQLLQCRARYDGEPHGRSVPPVIVTLPDGKEISTGDAAAQQELSEYLRKPVSIWPLQPKSKWRHYRLNGAVGAREMKRQFGMKKLPDLSSIPMLTLAELMFFVTPLGRYHDVFPLHVLSTNALAKMAQIEPDGDFQVQRFRPNILIESTAPEAEFDDFSWVGGELQIGKVLIKCESRTVRCSAPAQPQFGLDKDSKVIRAVDKHAGRHLGINATVVRRGEIRVGDEVCWRPARRQLLGASARNYAGQLKNKLVHAGLEATDKLNRN